MFLLCIYIDPTRFHPLDKDPTLDLRLGPDLDTWLTTQTRPTPELNPRPKTQSKIEPDLTWEKFTNLTLYLTSTLKNETRLDNVPEASPWDLNTTLNLDPTLDPTLIMTHGLRPDQYNLKKWKLSKGKELQILGWLMQGIGVLSMVRRRFYGP